MPDPALREYVDLDTGDPTDYVMRGHIGAEAFRAAVLATYERTVAVEHVRQRWMRLVPYRDCDGEYQGMRAVFCRRGRGATPVTVAAYEDTAEAAYCTVCWEALHPEAVRECAECGAALCGACGCRCGGKADA